MAIAKIGVVGGTGLDQIEGFRGESLELVTPFGSPSAPYTVGELGGVSVAFLNRHGRGHSIAPHRVPNAANIWGFKHLGVEALIAVSAVGSLAKDIEPGHMVVPDQIIDQTRRRPTSFFDEDVVAHVSLADPYCDWLSQRMYDVAGRTAPKVHQGGRLVVIEGPRFSTRAESDVFRQMGGRIIGMTATEAGFAREAAIPYGAYALSTDYDSWHQDEVAVTMEMVSATMRGNIANVTTALHDLIPTLGGELPDCDCRHAMDFALATDLSVVDEQRLERFRGLLPQLG